jgi:hypothetical protein
MVNLDKIEIVKILNMSYIFLLHFFPALIYSHIFDKIFDNRTEEEYNKTSTIRIFIEIWLHFWLILILYYIFSTTIVKVPSPFDNFFNTGFKNSSSTELKSSLVFSITFLMFQTSLKEKIEVFKSRILKYLNL